MTEIKLPIDDALWLLDFAPSFKECGDAQRLLRISALIYEASGLKGITDELWVRINAYPSHKKVTAIKIIRDLSGYGLKEAKDACELNHWFKVQLDKFDSDTASKLLISEGFAFDVSPTPFSVGP